MEGFNKGESENKELLKLNDDHFLHLNLTDRYKKYEFNKNDTLSEL